MVDGEKSNMSWYPIFVLQQFDKSSDAYIRHGSDQLDIFLLIFEIWLPKFPHLMLHVYYGDIPMKRVREADNDILKQSREGKVKNGKCNFNSEGVKRLSIVEHFLPTLTFPTLGTHPDLKLSKK